MTEPASSPATAAVTIRRMAVSDAEAVARTMGHPDVFGNLMQLPHPSAELWHARLTAQAAAPDDAYRIVAVIDGQVVGNAGIDTNKLLRRRHAGAIGISVAVDFQGRGAGKAMMQALVDYADGWGQMLRLELAVFGDNRRAIALYERFGFRHEGTHRCFALRDGIYEDVHTMARLHPRPPQVAWPAP